MKHSSLRDLAKFGAGLIAGDLLGLWWAISNDFLPFHFLSIEWTAEMVVPALMFDLALFLLLIHYGWNLGKIPRLRERAYLSIAGIIFGLITVAHLTRLVFGNIIIGFAGWMVPLWLSWFGVIIAGYLAYMSFVIAVRK